MSTKNKISLKKLSEFNTVWHEESALVFKSAKELVIVGKLVNKQIMPLEEEDIQLCDKYRFKYQVAVMEEEDAEEEDIADEETAVEEGGEEEEEEVEGEEEEVSEEDLVKQTDDTPVDKEEEVAETVPKKEEVVAEKKGGDDEFTNAVHNITKLWDTTNSKYRSQIKHLEGDLDVTKKELEELHDKYNKMKVKFDGIKQLFSV